VVGGPINEKTGNPYGPTTKAYKEWAEAESKVAISDLDAATIEEMAASVAEHREASSLLADGIPEATMRCEYLGHKCQARADWINADRGLVDFKTCRDLDDFESDANRYGYPHQLAFYQAMIHLVTGQLYPVHIIATEKKEPYRTGVWHLHATLMLKARRRNEDALAELERCKNTGVWPTRYETTRLIDRLDVYA